MISMPGNIFPGDWWKYTQLGPPTAHICWVRNCLSRVAERCVLCCLEWQNRVHCAVWSDRTVCIVRSGVAERCALCCLELSDLLHCPVCCGRTLCTVLSGARTLCIVMSEAVLQPLFRLTPGNTVLPRVGFFVSLTATCVTRCYPVAIETRFWCYTH